MKNWFKRTYFEVSTPNEKFHYISRDLHLVNLDHCVPQLKLVIFGLLVAFLALMAFGIKNTAMPEF